MDNKHELLKITFNQTDLCLDKEVIGSTSKFDVATVDGDKTALEMAAVLSRGHSLLLSRDQFKEIESYVHDILTNVSEAFSITRLGIGG